MKILYFHNSVPEYRKELFVKLAEHNNIKYIFTNFNYSKNIYNTDVDNAILTKIDYFTLFDGWKCIDQTYKVLAEFKPDIVILPALDTFREFIIAVSILNKVSSDVRIIYVWEKWEAPFEYITVKKIIKNSIQGLAAKLVFSMVDLFLAPGIKTKEYFLKHQVAEKKIHLFHDVSTVEKCSVIDLKEKYKIDTNKKIYLYYGRIIKRKGLDILIKAISKFKYRENIHLIVAGEGEYKHECERLAKELGLTNITFVGFVPPENKYQYFSQSDVFVLPSVAYEGIIEAWGLTVNEAILSNNLVICSDIVGAAYELLNENNGIIFKQGNIDKLVSAIEKAYFFEKTDLFYENNKKIIEEYTYTQMCKDFESAFRKVVNL